MSRAGLLLVALVSCTGDEPADDGSDTDAEPSAEPPVVTVELGLPSVLPDGGSVLGVRSLRVGADRPVTVTLAISVDDTTRTVAFEELAADQELPVLGLRLGKEHQVVVTATDAEGLSTAVDPLAIEGDPLPPHWPVIDVLANDVPRVQPGWLLIEAKNTSPNTHLVFLDPELQPSSTYTYVNDLQDTDLVGDGTFITRMQATGWQIDLLGNVIHQWGFWEQDPEHYIPTDTEDFHHEIIPLGTEQFAVLSSREIRVDAFPRSYETPLTLGPPADLWDSSLAVIDNATGTVIDQWFVSDYLDTTRISFDALTFPRVEWLDGVYDWSHANAADIDVDGGWVIAIRHQDVVMKLDADGNLVWLLGDPAGWGPEWRPYLLQPVGGGGFKWPYHAHGVAVDKASGLVLMFDNANNNRTPYEAESPYVPLSRAVAFRVDPVAMTVSQEWEYGNTTNGRLFARTQGATYVQPNGNVFAVFGTVSKEGSLPNVQAGWGEMCARIVEWAADEPQTPVLDLRLRSDRATDKDGWSTYRANKVPTLYPTVGPWRATETWAR